MEMSSSSTTESNNNLLEKSVEPVVEIDTSSAGKEKANLDQQRGIEQFRKHRADIEATLNEISEKSLSSPV